MNTMSKQEAETPTRSIRPWMLRIIAATAAVGLALGALLVIDAIAAPSDPLADPGTLEPTSPVDMPEETLQPQTPTGEGEGEAQPEEDAPEPEPSEPTAKPTPTPAPTATSKPKAPTKPNPSTTKKPPATSTPKPPATSTPKTVKVLTDGHYYAKCEVWRTRAMSQDIGPDWNTGAGVMVYDTRGKRNWDYTYTIETLPPGSTMNTSGGPVPVTHRVSIWFCIDTPNIRAVKVVTNEFYDPTCPEYGYVGTHEPGPGGTSRPSYKGPWFYKIEKVSIKYYLCADW